MKRNSPQDVWRFIEIRGEDDCWNWTGRTTLPINGYGYIGIGGFTYVAHRVVYWLMFPCEITMNAPIDKTKKEFVLHRCDNRLCCNPRHLFLGNYQDNNSDRVAKGRSSHFHGVKGIKNYAAKLTMEQAREIRWLASKGLSNGEIQSLYSISNEATRRVVKHISYKEQ